MNNDSLSWALNFLSGTPFRLFLLAIFALTLIRFLLRLISFMSCIRIAVTLLIIAFTPQLMHFFERMLKHFT